MGSEAKQLMLKSATKIKNAIFLNIKILFVKFKT